MCGVYHSSSMKPILEGGGLGRTSAIPIHATPMLVPTPPLAIFKPTFLTPHTNVIFNKKKITSANQVSYLTDIIRYLIRCLCTYLGCLFDKFLVEHRASYFFITILLCDT